TRAHPRLFHGARLEHARFLGLLGPAHLLLLLAQQPVLRLAPCELRGLPRLRLDFLAQAPRFLLDAALLFGAALLLFLLAALALFFFAALSLGLLARLALGLRACAPLFFLHAAALFLFPALALDFLARLALFLEPLAQRLGFAQRALGLLAHLALDFLAHPALGVELRLHLGFGLRPRRLHLRLGRRLGATDRLLAQAVLGVQLRLGLGLDARLGLRLLLDAVALGLRLRLGFLPRLVERRLLFLRALRGIAHLRLRRRGGGRQRTRRGLDRRHDGGEVEVVGAAGRRGRRLRRGRLGRGLRRRDRGPRLRGRGSGSSDLAHEALFVELRDELLELPVEAFADLLRHLA